MGSDPKPWWQDYVKWGPSAVCLLTIGTAFIDVAWVRAFVSVWLVAAALGLGEVRGLRFAGKPFAGDTAGRLALAQAQRTAQDGGGEP